MIITALRFGKDRLFHLYVDGELVCKLTDETVYRNRLKENMELSRELLEDLRAEAERQAALRDAAKILGASAQTGAGLLQKLKQKGHPAAEAKQAVRQMEQKGFLNDKSYAQSYVNDALRLKKSGKTKILFELRKKGVSEEIIQEALEDTEEDQRENLRALVQKGLAAMPAADRRQVDKLKRRLYAKGYGIHEIQSALAEADIPKDEDL